MPAAKPGRAVRASIAILSSAGIIERRQLRVYAVAIAGREVGFGWRAWQPVRGFAHPLAVRCWQRSQALGGEGGEIEAPEGVASELEGKEVVRLNEVDDTGEHQE